MRSAPRRVALLRSASRRVALLRSAPRRSASLRFASMRFAPPRFASEGRPAEVRLAEVRPAEVRPAEVRPAEVRPAEIRPYVFVLLYPLIPHSHSLFQECEMCGIGHGGLSNVRRPLSQGPVNGRAADAENTCNGVRGFAFGAELAGVFDLLASEFAFWAGPDASGSGCLYTGACALDNQAPFKFREYAYHLLARAMPRP